MPTYTLPPPRPFKPAAPAATEVSGEDILFRDQLEVAAGDWRTINGSDAAEQSVRREASSNVGSLLRRPDWGMGVTQALFKNATKSSRDSIATQVRTRMLKNPRVGRFISAEVIKLDSVSGTGVIIKYEPVGVKRPMETLLKSKR